jgi:hypothetical protein
VIVAALKRSLGSARRPVPSVAAAPQATALRTKIDRFIKNLYAYDV